MNIRSILSCRVGGLGPCVGAVMLMVLFAAVPVGTNADEGPPTRTGSSVAEVSLSDLNLSTPEGMRMARYRLHAMAARLCAHDGGGRVPSSQPATGACVESTVANALRDIDALGHAHMAVLNSVTLSARVSLADLDLSTLEGAGIARQRLEAMARHLCGELARRQDLSFQPNYEACVQDTLAGALAQADALAAARSTQTARRNAP